MTLPRTPSFRLDGRRALVVGASSGIGAACAVALAEQGAEVTLCARREPEVQALADEMRTAGMVAQVILGVAARGKAGTTQERDLAVAHQVIGYTTFGAMTAGAVVLFF